MTGYCEAAGSAPTREDDLERPLYSDVAPKRDARPVRRELDGPVRSRTSLNVWADPAPVGPGSILAVTVGAKCLDGSEATNRTVVVLDGEGTAETVSHLEAPASGTSLAEARFSLKVPEQPGSYAWKVAVAADATHPGAVKPLYFTVVPAGQRSVTLRVKDARTGVPCTDAVAFFYGDAVKGKPVSSECEEGGVVQTRIAGNTAYRVRVECTHYHEASLAIPAGNEPFEADIPLESTLWDPIGLGGRRFDQF